MHISQKSAEFKNNIDIRHQYSYNSKRLNYNY